MKKKSGFLAAVAFFAAAVFLTGCSGSGKSGEPDKKSKEPISVVTTSFSGYDWTRQILGDSSENVEVTLLGIGTDIHNYQPTIDDILKISKSDIFIYSGGESEEWVRDVLEDSENKDKEVINFLEILGSNAKEEETVEGMKEVRGEEESWEEDEPEYDEHVWLSLKNAEIFCESIEDVLAEADKSHADEYMRNVSIYEDKLKDLDARYKKWAGESDVQTLVFADRFPFRYLTDDYGLDYIAAFAGCSAETEASFSTIAFLTDKVDELGVKSIFKIDGGSSKIAETIIRNTKTKDQKILTLDSLQAVTGADIKSGKTYLSAMEGNLTCLTRR